VADGPDAAMTGTKSRFLAWNIRDGGAARLPMILHEVKKLDPDFITFSEVWGTYLRELIDGLSSIGLPYIETRCPEGNLNSVIVASKMPLVVQDDEIKRDPERWLPVQVPSLSLSALCVHIPDATASVARKQEFWFEVMRWAQKHKHERALLLGDFNTGMNDIDKTRNGTALKLWENIPALRIEGYRDVWRLVNPKNREYTWFTWRNGKELNGFRLDHIYVSSELRDLIVDARHIHHVRGLVDAGGLSDHAMIVADLAVAPEC